ncbi:MAG: AAA family ATPase, partial [Pseudomonadota bacterium]
MSQEETQIADFEVAPAAPADADRAFLRLAPEDMARLGVRSGDVVAVTGRRPTHLRVLPAQAANRRPGVVHLDPRACENAGTAPGDAVSVTAANLPPAERVGLTPLEGCALPSNAQDLARGLLNWPATPGDTVAVARPGRGLALYCVAETEPAGAVRITHPGAVHLTPGETEITPRFQGIGGLALQTQRLREMVDLPLRRPDLFDRLGLDPPRGVLFTGPPGSGKTLLARAVADEVEARFFQIDGPEIVSKHYGDSEQKLRSLFEAAARAAPAIIFIDEIDAIAPKRDGLSGEKQLERRVVAQLLTLMDGLDARGRVVVMAATNLPHALDPALRRPGRFDRELAFGAPDRQARAEILDIHLAGAARADDVDLPALAAATHGCVGADLAALAREAGIAALRRTGTAVGGVANIAVEDLAITQADLEAARIATRPSLLRETRVETPETRWSDIGGLEEAKAALIEAVIWPLRHASAMRRFGLSPAGGILLSGPPGGGKTMLAHALATESGVNFIPVRAATLLSPFLGAAERGVAELFDKARHAAPCVVFLDELDVIAPRRGRSDAALERVVAQLLIEIDSVAASGILVLAATNRPEAIDPALMRP